MANSAVNKGTVATWNGHRQTIVLTADTSASAVAVAMTFNHKPKYFYATRSGGAGTSVAELKITFDEANGEVDLTPYVEGSGTLAHEWTVFLQWEDSAEQDGSSITVS